MSERNYIEDELPSGVALEAAAQRYNYEQCSVRSDHAIDSVMNRVLANTMHHVAGPDGTRDALLWLLDGDVTDDHFDFALRVAARVREAGNGDQPADGPDTFPDAFMGSDAYVPTPGWSQEARELGENGLYLVGLEWRRIPLVRLERPNAPLRHTQFIHRLPGGTDAALVEEYFAADPRAGELRELKPLRSYSEVAEKAYDELVLQNAQQALGMIAIRPLAEAVALDSQSTALPDNLFAYKAATREQAEGASLRIKDLARALYAAGEDMMTPALLRQLQEPTVVETADWALMNKGIYHSITSAQEGRMPLHNRLEWIREVAPIWQDAMLLAGVKDAMSFKRKLTALVEHARHHANLATNLAHYMQPPATILPESPAWQVRAR